MDVLLLGLLLVPRSSLAQVSFEQEDSGGSSGPSRLVMCICQGSPWKGWLRQASWVKYLERPHGGSTGLCFGAFCAQGSHPGIPEEWRGACHSRPNPFSRHFLCKTSWARSSLGKVSSLQKAIKRRAHLKGPLEILQAPTLLSSWGNRLREVFKSLAQCHPDP